MSIVLEEHSKQGPPGYPRFTSGTVDVYELRTLDKVRLNYTYHLPVVGRCGLPRHRTAPGLSPNFMIESDPENHDQMHYVVWRVATFLHNDVEMGVYQYVRIAPSQIRELATNIDDRVWEAEQRHFWISEEAYLRDFKTGLDHTEFLFVIEFVRLVVIHGNLAGKENPPQLLNFLTEFHSFCVL